jgi:DNA-binding MarR family transcriptional regulator
MKHEGQRTPIGIALWETTQLVMRAFDKELAGHGGNRPIWFVFLALSESEQPTQRELARAVGIKEATLTHHLNALEGRGLITRSRDTADRRVQRVAFSPEGEAMFEALRGAAVSYEKRVRAALGPERAAALRESLAFLAEAVREPGKDEVLPPIA